MDLVYGDRSLACGCSRAMFCPAVVAPVAMQKSMHDRGIRRPALGGEGHRVGLERQQIASWHLDLELVYGAGSNPGQEQLPGAAFRPSPPRMTASVSAIKELGRASWWETVCQ